MVRRNQTASFTDFTPWRGSGVLTTGQLESSRVTDSPCGRSPAWKRHAPPGSAFSVSSVCSFSIADGDRFFSSRTGVKDWATTIEEDSASALMSHEYRMVAG